MAGTTCKCTFNVTIRVLKPSDSVSVCINDSAAASAFDPARCVRLERLAGDAATGAATTSSSPLLFQSWGTPKPIVIPWGGAPIKYKYAVFTNGNFSYWEKLS